MCAMLLVGNIEDNMGPLLYLYALFAFVSTSPFSPDLKHPCVLLTHPSRASTRPLVTGDICIFNGNYADCWGWAGLGCLEIYCKLNIQNTQPQSLGHTTQLHIAHFPLFQSSLFLKTFSLGLELRRSRR